MQRYHVNRSFDVHQVTLSAFHREFKRCADKPHEAHDDGINVVYGRYKTVRPFDKHQWFSCSKVVPRTMVELLALEGNDRKKPVSEEAGKKYDPRHQ